MSFNFFKAQDRARSKTFYLLVLTLLGVGLLSVLNYLMISVILGNNQPVALALTALLALLFCGTFIYFKLNNLSGADLAMALDGIPLGLNSNSANEESDRRLRNVVEEMSIASGLPVPQIFVLRHEKTINAFAAGARPGEQVVAVTQGALDHLNRDELQAVIAHEYAHLINEDMALNENLAVLVSGFLLMTKIGSDVLQTERRSRFRDESKVALIGLVLLAIGFLGKLWAILMQASISRQRELFADACSAQYTRHPESLAKALGKIFIHTGSNLSSSERFACAHIFFASASAEGFLSFSTHPKIQHRIQELLPSSDPEKFLEQMMTAQLGDEPVYKIPEHTIVAKQATAENLLNNVGFIANAQMLISQTFLRESRDFVQKLRDPVVARMVLTLLILRSQDNQVSLLEQLRSQHSEVGPLVRELEPMIASEPQRMVYIFQLCCGSLVTLPEQERKEIYQKIRALFENDGRLNLFEAALLCALQNILLSSKPKARVGFTVAEQKMTRLFAVIVWKKAELEEALLLFQSLQSLSLREKEVFLKFLGKILISKNEIEAYRLFSISIGVPIPPTV